MADIKLPDKLTPAMRGIAGGLTGMLVTSVLHPLEVIKVRLQLHNTNHKPMQFMQRVVRCEGFRALYRGLTGALARQATFTTTRIGVYNWLYRDLKKKHKKMPSIHEKVAFGLYAGAAGALAGTPAELAMVRMCGHQICYGPFNQRCHPCRHSCLPVCVSCTEPWHPCKLYDGCKYRGVFNTLGRIAREEGILSLWRGTFLTILRTAIITSIQITSYIHAREGLVRAGVPQNYLSHFTSAVFCSFITVACVLPVDVVKSRYQVTQGNRQVDILYRTFLVPSIPNLWKGFSPYFLRMTIHTTATFMLLDMANEKYKELVSEQRNKK